MSNAPHVGGSKNPLKLNVITKYDSMRYMKTIAQFKVFKDKNVFIAEGIDLAIVTEAKTLDSLVKNIYEAASLYFDKENVEDFDFSQKPSILVNYELPRYA